MAACCGCIRCWPSLWVVGDDSPPLARRRGIVFATFAGNSHARGLFLTPPRLARSVCCLWCLLALPSPFSSPPLPPLPFCFDRADDALTSLRSIESSLLGALDSMATALDELAARAAPAAAAVPPPPPVIIDSDDDEPVVGGGGGGGAKEVSAYDTAATAFLTQLYAAQVDLRRHIDRLPAARPVEAFGGRALTGAAVAAAKIGAAEKAVAVAVAAADTASARMGGAAGGGGGRGGAPEPRRG